MTTAASRAAATGGDAAAGPSAWAPLRGRVFAVIWAATLVSNVGMWVRDVASGWTMTELTPSPLMVALVQAALTFPIFVLALPAGALADIVDRRRLLIGVQAFIALVSAGLALASWLGAMTPALLLAFTICGGIGAALLQPSFQAIVPELVARGALRQAVALNSMGINLARAIGPALGGALVAAAGVAAAYLFDALATLVVVAAFLWWRRPPTARPLPPESFVAGIAQGVRYARGSRPLRVVVLRALAFFVFASAYWALLPLVARDLVGGDAGLYGLMLTAIGLGAVTGALVLPRLAGRIAPSRIVAGGSLATAAVALALASAPNAPVVLAALFCAGAAWIAVLTSLNVAAQTSLPDWVRARGMAIYLAAFYGAMAAGSALWGRLAQVTSLEIALLAAAAGGALAALAAARIGLPDGGGDLAPALAWGEPQLADARRDDGPVLVTVEYEIDPADHPAFLAAADALGRVRRRNGAFGWRVWRDASDERVFVETFQAATWLDHLRQHDRLTGDDARLRAAVHAFHRGDAPPRVRHALAARPAPSSPVSEPA